MTPEIHLRQNKLIFIEPMNLIRGFKGLAIVENAILMKFGPPI